MFSNFSLSIFDDNKIFDDELKMTDEDTNALVLHHLLVI